MSLGRDFKKGNIFVLLGTAAGQPRDSWRIQKKRIPGEHCCIVPNYAAAASSMPRRTHEKKSFLSPFQLKFGTESYIRNIDMRFIILTKMLCSIRPVSHVLHCQHSHYESRMIIVQIGYGTTTCLLAY